jgi:hypothetical protein
MCHIGACALCLGRTRVHGYLCPGSSVLFSCPTHRLPCPLVCQGNSGAKGGGARSPPALGRAVFRAIHGEARPTGLLPSHTQGIEERGLGGAIIRLRSALTWGQESLNGL